MQSYSLVNSVYPNELIPRQQLLENLADKFWASNYGFDQLDEYSGLVCEGNLLLEFSVKEFIKDNLANVFQAGIGFALETGISVGTLGAGAPAGVASEMLNDMCFFGYSAAEAIASIKDLFAELGEMKEAVVEMMSSTVKDAPQKIYDRVKSVVNKLGAFFQKLKIDVKKGIEKLIEIYRKFMRKLAKVAGDVVGLISPIPGTDAAVQNAIVEFTDDAYKAMIKLFDKLPGFVKEYINNPLKMGEDVGKIIDATLKFLRKMYGIDDSGKEKSFLKKVASTVKDAAVMGPVGMLMKKAGAYEKIISWLDKNAKSLVDKSLEAYEKIYPVLMSACSALTIIVSGDHDLFKGSDKTKNEVKKSLLDLLTKEEIGRNYHTLNNKPYSMEDNTDIDTEVYVNTDGTWTAQVSSKINASWSTPVRNFKDEHSAQSWVQKNIDIITRKQINEDHTRVKNSVQRFNSIH